MTSEQMVKAVERILRSRQPVPGNLVLQFGSGGTLTVIEHEEVNKSRQGQTVITTTVKTVEQAM